MKIFAFDGGYDNYGYEENLFGKENFVVFPAFSVSVSQKIEKAKKAYGLLIRGTLVNDEFLANFPNLKAIVRYGVGYDNIDLNAATNRGIKVANVQGYANHSVSDHAVALLYSCARSIRLAKEALENKFSQPPRLEMFEFHDKTIGVIGIGRIGGTLCKKVKPLFKRVLGCDPYIPQSRFDDLGVENVSLDELLENSRAISLNCNLTDKTRGLINERTFGLMKQKPILINTARGPLIDECALEKALNQSLIHSAGLDVFEDEPPTKKQRAILTHPNVTATGHYAWYSDSASKELQHRAADNLYKLLQGEIPEDCLNP